MRRFLAIPLLAIYLLGTTDAYQLLKLPLLVEHYIQHRQENHALSLWGFIKTHYVDKTVIDADYNQDMKLPFKTNENDGCLSLVKDLPVPIGIQFERPPVPKSDHILRNTALLYVRAPRSIFQPPRA